MRVELLKLEKILSLQLRIRPLCASVIFSKQPWLQLLHLLNATKQTNISNKNYKYL